MARAQILIAEDDGAVALTTKKLVERMGFSVCAIVPSGEEVIDKAKEHKPDLVLMDIILKGKMDGVEAADKIRSELHIPIVYVTAYADEKVLERAKITEPCGYVLKPFGERELKTAVEMALYKHKAEQALQKAHDELEQRVQERTAELTKSNQQLKHEITERQRAEMWLRESEKRYRALAENVADGVGIFQEGTFVFANEALASIFGYRLEQWVGIDPVVVFREDYKERFKEVIQQLENGIYIESFQAPCIRKDGREIWTEGRHNIVLWEGRHAVLVTVRDITESKLAEIATEDEKQLLERENIRLKATMKDRFRFGHIVGKSAPMQQVYELVLKASACDANVVIYGESGTGKELIAQTIHEMSVRNGKPLVTVNCGAVPESLFEAEFFGYRKGAFTGANADRMGFFDLAHGGTLFLDEVGELYPAMQSKLLRAIESKGYTPVGDNKASNADVRIVTATNRDLADMVRKGLFRKDFFYRIDVIAITAPPLRDRKEDIPLLVEHFMSLHGDGNQEPTIGTHVMESLHNHDWPGNVRELQNVLERYLATKQFDLRDTHAAQPVHMGSVSDIVVEQGLVDLRSAMKDIEKDVIARTLKQTHWNIRKTSSMLGLPRRTLSRKMQEFGLH